MNVPFSILITPGPPPPDSPSHRSGSVWLFLLLWLCLPAMLPAQTEEGKASYYSDKFQGKPTSSGELYDKAAYTAAHPTLPFGSRVSVLRLDNNKRVEVRINDRGPFSPGRIIDLSRAAAEEIGLIQDGIATVQVSVLERATPPPKAAPTPALPATTSGGSPSSASYYLVDPASVPLRDHQGRLLSDPEPNSGQAHSPDTQNQSSQVAGYPEQVPAALENKLFQVSTVFDGKGYGVQVGAYFEYASLLRAIGTLNEQGFVNSMIHSDEINQKQVFRVILGPVETAEEAELLLRSLSAHGYKGIIKELGDFH